MTLDEYLDLAKDRQAITSDRQLAFRLGQRGTCVTQYRRNNILPGTETMIRLAELAGRPVEVALMDLELWRNKEAGPGTQQVLVNMRDTFVKLSRTAAGVAVAVGAAAAAFAPLDASAAAIGRIIATHNPARTLGNTDGTTHQTPATTVYYGKLRTWFRRLLALSATGLAVAGYAA